MIKAGVIGAAGYTAGELLRILVHHPKVDIAYAQSESQAGKPLFSTHQDLLGETDLLFSQDIGEGADVVFLCKGHGESKKIVDANPHLLESKIVDLSHDFRLQGDHDFVYGLPEVNKDTVAKSVHIANPGCFATSIQLGLLPAVVNGLVAGDVHTSGITGSTGAGQSFSATSHFSWRSNNASVYKPFTHQHLQEIGETLLAADKEFKHAIHFIPYRGAFTRGIITTSYFASSATEEQLKEAYLAFYENDPFTYVVDKNPDLKMVVNTNKSVVFPTKIGDQVMVISIIDNLLKGASGQAVQNMNILFGLDEKEGLHLKSTCF